MAEVLIKVGPGAGYEDGDVLCAFNRRRIRCVHADHLCHVTRAGFTSHGLRPSGSLAEDQQAETYRYRFRRSGLTVIRRDLVTSEEEVFGPEAIDVVLYLARRLRHPRHRIFGALGAEVWYGGRQDRSDTALDRVWQRITHHTGRFSEETEFTLWPMGRLDIRHHLALRIDDFSDAEAQAYEAPLTDGEDEDGLPIVVSKRARRVRWRDLLGDLGVSEADVFDHSVPVGRDVQIGAGRWRHESKGQPRQPRERVEERVR